MSIFADNTLNMSHVLIKMADISRPADGSRPSIRLNGKAFALHTREDHPLGPETMLMHLPLREGYSSTPATGRTSFLPPPHSLLYASMNRANGFRMLENAGMTRRDMDVFLDHHGDHSSEYPTWLLGDLMGVAHHSHIPSVIPFDGRDDYWSSDEDEPAPPPYDESKLYVSTLYHHAPLPRLWASFAGCGTVPDMHVPAQQHGENTFRNKPRTPGPWWVRTKGFICNSCTTPLMSHTFARKLNLTLAPLDGTLKGPIIELGDRPSHGWNQLSTQPHRAKYQGIGQAAVEVDFSMDPRSPRRATITFIIFEDSILPRGSSVDYVINGAFARQSPGWVDDALMNDEISQSYRRGLSGPSHCELPRTTSPSSHSAREPTSQRRLPSRDLAMTATHQLKDLGQMVFHGVEDKNEEKWHTTFSAIFGAFAWRVRPEGLASCPTNMGKNGKRDTPPTRESVTTRRVFLAPPDDPVLELVQERIMVAFPPGQFVTRRGCSAPTEVLA